MMGRVVAHKLLPLQKYAPFLHTSSSSEPHNPEDIIPDILPEPSLSTNRSDILTATTDNSVMVALGSLFGINFARNHDAQVQLETKQVKTYALRNPDEFFDRLMENEGYAKDVQKLFAGMKKRRAYFVTGFLTTAGAKWTRTLEQGRTDGFNVAVPVTALAGVPLPPGTVDPSIAPSRTVRGGAGRTMEVEAEEIFAISYNLLKIRYRLGRNHGGREGTVFKGPQKVARLSELAFGDGEDEEQTREDTLAEANGDVFFADIEDDDDDDELDDDDNDDEEEKEKEEDGEPDHAPYFTLNV